MSIHPPLSPNLGQIFIPVLSVTLGLILLAGTLYLTFQPDQEKHPAVVFEAAVVRVEPVVRGESTRVARFSAITRPVRQAVLSFTMPGRMNERLVEIGDRVRAGQVLARLDLTEFDHAVAMAEAAVIELEIQTSQAERDHHRFVRLQEDNVVEARQKEQVSAQYNQLRAALDGARIRQAEARRQRREAELRAPFEGVVATVRLEPGEWADPGRPILELADDHGVKLEVEVPETVIGQLQQGQRVDIRLPFFGDRQVGGHIDHLSDTALDVGRLFPVIVTLYPGQGISPGVTADLLIGVTSGQDWLVPLSAVINPGGSRPSLFILNGDRVREVAVRPRRFDGDLALVAGNLAEGDLVVVQGQTSLAEGQEVMVRQ